MGILNFPLNLRYKYPMENPAAFEQVKSNAEPVIQHCSNVFPCIGLNVGAVLPELFRQN